MTTNLPTQKRIELLDVFRGFAVFGIFVVNIEIMNCVFMNQGSFSQLWTEPMHKVAVRILQLFFYSKFFPIFSFLFGLGLTMQVIRLKERNTLSFFFIGRRMGALFLFGACHVFFLWGGDVIHLYAIFGLGIGFFLKWSNRWLLGLAILLLLFPFYDQLSQFIFEGIGYNPTYFIRDYTSEAVTEILQKGSYLEGLHFRVNEYLSNLPVLLVFMGPIALSMFLLGVYFGKKKYVFDLERIALRIQLPILILFVSTTIYRLFFLFYVSKLEWEFYGQWRSFFHKAMLVSDVLLGLFYLWMIVRLWQWKWFKKLMSPLKSVGRMALTNYILQSVIGLFLFSDLGFGLYETLSPLLSLIYAVLVFGVLFMYSSLWLRYFKYGPLEWIWRCITYKQLLSIKK